MTIQFNTDKNIHGSEALKNFVSERVEDELKHYAEHLTRIEIHLSDQNAHKAGADDIQCKIEARVQGKQPVLVMAASSEKEKAIEDALDKMKARLAKIIGKMKNK
jgi:ribosomal subunit interface protein